MRQIILDTETTGIDPAKGHRIIEICALEMVDRKLTGSKFYSLVNPKRKVEEQALAIHGISDAKLADAPTFEDIKKDFISFISPPMAKSKSEIIIYNAQFDVGHIDNEFRLDAKAPLFLKDLALIICCKKMIQWIDNVDKYTKGYRLDDMKTRFNVDIARELHGAEVDCAILAEVYLAITRDWYES